MKIHRRFLLSLLLCTLLGNAAAHLPTIGWNSLQCGQPYEKNSITSIFAGVSVICAGTIGR